MERMVEGRVRRGRGKREEEEGREGGKEDGGEGERKRERERLTYHIH